MATIALPTEFRPSSFSPRLSTVQRSNESPFGGSQQVIDLLNDKWMFSLTLPKRSRADGARIEAFIAAMRGMTNVVNLYHFGRKVPRGTMRGAPTTISNPAGQGQSSIFIAASLGASLLAGDMLGIAGLLLQVSDDCFANGVGNITVPLTNRLRRAIPAGTPVTWDRPTAPFRLISESGVQYAPGYTESVPLDFMEAI